MRRRVVVRAIADHRDDGPWAIVTIENAASARPRRHACSSLYTTTSGGLGMGLSISRSILDSHGGRLWATANSDHGATFYFQLPGMR